MTSTPPAGDGHRAGPAGRRAGLTARFLLAVGHEVGAGALTPSALARAVTRVVPVDGAGLSSLTGALRLPLGSSSVSAARAGELQTSLGEGPWRDTAARQAPLSFDLAELATRWPRFTRGLVAETALRSAASVPLRRPGGKVFASLDLWSTGATQDASLDLVELERHVVGPAAALLSTCLEEIHRPELLESRPDWHATAAGRRHNVWVAIGMVMTTRAARTEETRSLMRAQASTSEPSLDDLAEECVDGRLPPADVAG